LGRQIAECDDTIGKALQSLPTLTDRTSAPVKAMRNPHRTTAQQAQLHQALNEVLGVDLTRVPTLGIDTVLVLASEIGPNLSRFPSARHFCSWLGLAPPTHISGGKTLTGPKAKVFNRAGQALRQAALNARRSQTFIGAAHRARLARMDTAKAVKATAHQLARLIYAMLTQGQDYVERGMEEFEVRSRDRQLRSIQRKAKQLGLTLSEAA
jgi:transposase